MVDIATMNYDLINVPLYDTLGAEAMALFDKKNITNVPVVDAGKIRGILHIHDCLNAALA